MQLPGVPFPPPPVPPGSLVPPDPAEQFAGVLSLLVLWLELALLVLPKKWSDKLFEIAFCVAPENGRDQRA